MANHQETKRASGSDFINPNDYGQVCCWFVTRTCRENINSAWPCRFFHPTPSAMELWRDSVRSGNRAFTSACVTEFVQGLCHNDACTYLHKTDDVRYKKSVQSVSKLKRKIQDSENEAEEYRAKAKKLKEREHGLKEQTLELKDQVNRLQEQLEKQQREAGEQKINAQAELATERFKIKTIESFVTSIFQTQLSYLSPIPANPYMINPYKDKPDDQYSVDNPSGLNSC
jgi:hypothetical protein